MPKEKLPFDAEELTKRQTEFLELRNKYTSDSDTLRAMGYSEGSVSGGVASSWKHDSPNFEAAYNYVVSDASPEEIQLRSTALATKLKELQLENKDDVATALEDFLPRIVAEHLDLIQHAKSEPTRLNAIKLAYEITGITDDEDKTPRVQQNLILLQGAMENIQREELGISPEKFFKPSDMQTIEGESRLLEEDD